MRRGDIVIVSAQGDHGKPRPAVVVQSDWLSANDSVLVALCTTTLIDAPTPIYRLTVEPSATNGLERKSQIQVDKIVAMRRHKCRPTNGRLDDGTLTDLNHMLSVVIGLADGPKPPRHRRAGYRTPRFGKPRFGS